MANSIASNYATPMANTSSTSSSSTTSSNSASDLGSTFLNLLSQELMHQDPTDPMDSTAMVGQMISLNQLQQLISIKQTLGGMDASTSSSSSTSSGTATSGSTTTKSDVQVGSANTAAATQAAAAAKSLQYDPTASLSAGSDYTSALAAAINSSRNVQSTNLSSAIANMAGGR